MNFAKHLPAPLGDFDPNSEMGMSGDLQPRLIRGPRPHSAKVIRTPFGRMILTRDKGDSTMLGNGQFTTHVSAVHRSASGRVIKEYDLGSGLVTNVGVLALANDWNLAAPSGAAINTLKLANWHVSGTGATAAAATDIKLQTQSTNGGQTPVAGTQTLVSAANLQKLQTVATIAYTGTEAVTEWGLICASTISSATGSPFTAGSATTGTVTATPLTASSSTVQGQQQTIFENTGNATPSWGLVTSNTTSVVTVPAWYKVSDGTAGANPANTNAYTIRPVMWDHKQFAAINVVNGDSIQFSYLVAMTSGG
jgi:hypothetical protein